jgi:hypothetical protein
VGVVGDHQDRGTFRKVRQQGEHGDPGEERVRSTGVRGEAERAQQGLCLPARKTGGTGQHRPQELMQPGEREFRLRFPAGDRQDPHARRPGPSGCVGKEHGLAHAGLADDEQDLTGMRNRLHEPTQPRKTGFPANDATGLRESSRAWHMPVLTSASAFINAVSRLFSVTVACARGQRRKVQSQARSACACLKPQ